MGHQPRRRPPACSLCRIRKLRCNRQLPCSNCSIRGIPCHRDIPRGPRLLPGNGSQKALDRNHLAPSSLASTQLQLISADVLDIQNNCANRKLLVCSSDSWMLDRVSWKLKKGLCSVGFVGAESIHSPHPFYSHHHQAVLFCPAS